jgi:hypothetical protein
MNLSKKGNLIFLSFVASLAFAGTGCGKVQFDLNMLDSVESVTPDAKLSKGAEFVAGSQQGQTTLNGYKVDSTVGSVFSKLETTTANGYKVYSTVQGHMLSEERAKSATR